MDEKRTMTGMAIHSFAVAHAVTAAVLAQTIVGDEMALTALTISMIIMVAKLNGAKWDTGMSMAFLGVFIGGYVGVRGATMLVKWIPGIGNIANAAVTFATTEGLGWATYLYVKNGGEDPSSMSPDEVKSLWEEATQISKEEETSSKKMYESMSPDDKEEYDEIMKQFRIKDLPDSTREYLTGRMEKILKKYTG